MGNSLMPTKMSTVENFTEVKSTGWGGFGGLKGRVTKESSRMTADRVHFSLPLFLSLSPLFLLSHLYISLR